MSCACVIIYEAHLVDQSPDHLTPLLQVFYIDCSSLVSQSKMVNIMLLSYVRLLRLFIDRDSKVSVQQIMICACIVY